jgi:CRISPR/Cas system Type II protein with McrA/HNH and RuvC-like nuclease domain
MQARERYVLGLDLGTNSLGWAALRLDENGKPARQCT